MGKPIDIADLTVVYGSQDRELEIVALEGITLHVPANQFVCIVGRSGCGKTTLLNSIDGGIRPACGSIRIDGKETIGHGRDRAMVFQQASLFPWSTAVKNAAYGLELQGLDRVEAEGRAREFLSMVGLAGYESYYPAQLSGGMQQRVNLARALALDPEIILLDEPFGALDAQTREFMQGELTRLWQQFSKTAIFITHDISEAIFLADRVIVLSSRPGRVKADFQIDLPRPRTIAIKRTPEFLEYEEAIWSLLHDETASNRISVAPEQEDKVPVSAIVRQAPLSHQNVAKDRASSSGVASRNRFVPARGGARKFILGFSSTASVILAWQLAARLGWINVAFSSSPSDILKSAIVLFQEHSFWTDVYTSASEFGIGFLIAIVLGIFLGIVVGWYDDANAVLAPFVTGLYATPRISLAPLLIVWLGIGLASKVTLVTLSSIFPILINTASGIRTTDRQFVRVARSFGANDWVLFKTVAIPAAVPHIVSGLRLGSGLGIIGVVVGELIAGNAGIGYRMLLAGQTFQVADMFVCLLVFTCAGMLLSMIFTRFEQRFDSWRRAG